MLFFPFGESVIIWYVHTVITYTLVAKKAVVLEVCSLSNMLSFVIFTCYVHSCIKLQWNEFFVSQFHFKDFFLNLLLKTLLICTNIEIVLHACT